MIRVVGDEKGCDMQVTVLRTFGARLKGLLGTGPEVGPVLLVKCGSIHTWGMHYPIDVALIDAQSCVRASWRSLRPGKVVAHRDAVMALERPSTSLWWPDEGDMLFSSARE